MKNYRNFNAQDYINLVENSSLQVLNNFMEDEIKLIRRVSPIREKTFYDLGAGHGRLIPYVAPIYKNYLGIEINSLMLEELNKRCLPFDNSLALKKDITKLHNLQIKTKDNLFALAQNTIGTIEGSHMQVLESLKKTLRRVNGEVIISFFKAEAMNTFGRNELFPELNQMIGDIDLKSSNLKKGELITKTGYTSKWWSDAEIEELLSVLEMKLIQRIETSHYSINYLV